MSEHLPNDNSFRDDLPLPNEEEAWQKMKLLLDEEDKRRRPFWVWRFALLALLLIGLTAGGYLLLNRKVTQQAVTINIEKNTQNLEKNLPVEKMSIEKKKTSQVPVTPTTDKSESLKVDKTQSLELETVPPSATSDFKEVKEKKAPKETVAKQREKYTVQKKSIDSKQTIKRNTDDLRTLNPEEIVLNAKPPFAQKSGRIEGVTNRIQPSPLVAVAIMKSNRVDKSQVETKKSSDSMKVLDSVKLVTTPPAVNNKKQKKRSRFEFSAGVGLQQAIAFGGQQASSYNLNGKQNRLSDHIPSAYLRVQSGKWFLQGELQYHVPQPVEQFSFSQTTSYDAVNKTLQRERLSIQKLYYHQLPVSINYFVLPDWSWGAGGTYSLFAGAVTGQELTSRNMATGAETVFSQVVPMKGYTDSFLYRSTAGILLQTDYHWRRFSVGLRYTQNLQSFIKYTTPDGAVLSEKNRVLQAVLRFRLL